MKKVLPFFFIVFISVIFFWQFLFKGLLPIPSDTIIGLYHPFRDLYAKNYPNGIPFKNFLITDPVRQQYPWRELAVSLEKRSELPLWNPYSFSGTPLLANLQSAVFYPPNLLFFVLPFQDAWSILVILQPLLAGIFLYLYLQSLRVSKTASFIGGFVFAFSGFSIAWLEWNTVLHVGLWLPLILLAIDKIFFYLGKISNSKYKIENIHFKNKKLIIWSFVFIFSLVSSFFAGHLQTFFYLLLLSTGYFFVRWFQYGKSGKTLTLFAICYLLFAIAAAIQWMPTLQFILESARSVDIPHWQKEGWFRFIPWQHLVQFVAPDFFGNPSTLNYWGAWNYGEFIGYVGILPLVMAVFALFFRRDKKTFFYGIIFFLSLIFSLPTIFAKIPYMLNIPFISTSQPTRLLFVADFSLAILAAFGLDYFIKQRKKIFYPLGFIAFVLAGLWVFVLLTKNVGSSISAENLLVANRNLIFPTVLFISAVVLFFLLWIFQKKRTSTIMIYIIIVGVIVLDLLRFADKFTPFTSKEYLFPSTKTIEFLQENVGNYRIMTADSRILPPNFSVIYRLQSIDGYDPLYLQKYGELIAASERREPNISPPFGFNRIITPHSYDSKIIDFLGVKYVLSLSDLDSPKLSKVFQEGQTQVYENKEVVPRTFFVERVQVVNNKQEAIKIIFNKDFEPRKTAIVEKETGDKVIASLRRNIGKTEIISYSENKVVIKTENSEEGFLVLTDSFYPIWHAKVDGAPTKIYRTDYNFRGIIVPKGKHIVEFYATLL